MKKLIIISILAVLVSGATSYAEDSEYAITLVADTSTAILPPRKKGIVDIEGLWTYNTAVTNGEVWRVLSTGEEYMILETGTTSTNTYPSGKSGQVETNGTATAIHCQYLAPRDVAFITQESAESIWYHTGLTATTSGGEYTYLQGQQCRKDFMGIISAISTGAPKLNILDK